MENQRMKCKNVKINLKLVIKAPDYISKLYPLFKIKPLSSHVISLEIHYPETIFSVCEIFLLNNMSCIQYFDNIKKISGLFNVRHNKAMRRMKQSYTLKKSLVSRLKDITTDKLYCNFVVKGDELITENSEQPGIYSYDFSLIFPRQIIIMPSIILDLYIGSSKGVKISLRDFERLKYSLHKLTLIIKDDHIDLDEFKVLSSLQALKHLKLSLDDFDSWNHEDQNKIANIIRGLSIKTLEINIYPFLRLRCFDMKSSRIFPENLLIEISYLDNLESLSLGLYGDIEFNPTRKNDILKDKIYKHYKDKTQFAKLKKLTIECRPKTNLKLAIDSIIYNNNANLNNLESFELREGLKYILRNKDNIIFDNMNNLKYLTLFKSYYNLSGEKRLLKDADHFFKGINNLISLEYLNITSQIEANMDILQRSLMILNHLYNLKVFIMKWMLVKMDNHYDNMNWWWDKDYNNIYNDGDIDNDSNMGNDNGIKKESIMNEDGFTQWLQNNLICNDSLKNLNITIIPIGNDNTICKVIKIFKIKYKNLGKVLLRLGNTSNKFDLIKNFRRKNRFRNWFKQLDLE